MALTAVCFFGLLYLSVAPKELDNTFHIFLGFARAEDLSLHPRLTACRAFSTLLPVGFVVAPLLSTVQKPSPTWAEGWAGAMVLRLVSIVSLMYNMLIVA